MVTVKDIPGLTLNRDLQSLIVSCARFNTLGGGSKYFVNSGCGGGKGFLDRSEVIAPWKRACLMRCTAGL